MTISDRIHTKLTSKLDIFKLEVEDESHLHKGHAGYIEGGETHFKLTIISDDFEGKSRVLRHKLIYKALEDEIKERIHALSINAITKAEFNSGKN